MIARTMEDTIRGTDKLRTSAREWPKFRNSARHSLSINRHGPSHRHLGLPAERRYVRTISGDLTLHFSLGDESVLRLR